MQRREFLKSILPAAAVSQHLANQTDLPWGGPVPDADACFTHIQGCGVTRAVLLTPATDQDRAKAEMERRPGHFVRSVRTDPSQAAADKVLHNAIKRGAVSIGEMKFHVALNSPKMRRVYDIGAELQAPVMIHIQTFPHFEGELPYNAGYAQFDRILRADPRTNCIGHGDQFGKESAVPRYRILPRTHHAPQDQIDLRERLQMHGRQGPWHLAEQQSGGKPAH